MPQDRAFKPNLLTIVPPYAVWGPPAGAAALLAYLKAAGCHDFSFLDLRLFAPDVATPTYRVSGVFGESFVLDIPDLPLVLAILENVRRDRDPLAIADEVIEPYCMERGINSLYLRSYLRRMDNLVRSVFERLPALEFVGFSVWTSNYLTTLLAAACLKRRARPPFIVAGGPQVSQSTAAARLALAAGLFDAVAVGEGEETLLELYRNYSPRHGGLTAPVDGVVTHDRAGGTFPYRERPLLKLAELPLPDFDEMHLPAYRIAGKRVGTYQLSRGCTDKCTFCSERVFWRRFRMGGMARAVADVAELQRRWGVERIWFTDSLLNGHMGRLREFAEGLIEHRVEIEWSGYMRAQIDAETARLLRRAGCIRVFIGVESLDDETLERMNKRMTEAQNLEAVRTFIDAGIDVKVGLIPGFPGDTRERFMRTAAQLRRIQADSGRLTVSHEAFVVLPGQPIHDDPTGHGLGTVPWPEEVAAISPGLAEHARPVGWRFEGENQGLDRLGEFLISMSLIDAGHPTDRDSDETHEALSLFRLELAPVAAGVWLGRTLSPRGHIVGALLSEEERLWILDNAERGAGDLPAAPLCERPGVAEWLAEILGEHRPAITPEGPRVAPAGYRPPPARPTAEEWLAPGPFTIGRVLDGTLWLADLATGEAGGLAAAEPAGRALRAGGSVPLDQTTRGLVESGLLLAAP